MFRHLWILAILLHVVSGFVINDICNQWVDDMSIKVISSVPRNAKLFQARGSGVSSLVERLIENATSIRENITDSFTCDGKVYGYYADQDNDCQIFHICLPMQQLFPEMYCEEDIFHFSFICPKYTIFSQEPMVCDWTANAFPCSEADKLYARNNLLFVVPQEDVQRELPSATTPSPSTKRPSLCCANRKNPTPAPNTTPAPPITLAPTTISSALTTNQVPATLEYRDRARSENLSIFESSEDSENSTVTELPPSATEYLTATESELLDTTLPLFSQNETYTSSRSTSPPSSTFVNDRVPEPASATEPFWNVASTSHTYFTSEQMLIESQQDLFPPGKQIPSSVYSQFQSEDKQPNTVYPAESVIFSTLLPNEKEEDTTEFITTIKSDTTESITTIKYDKTKPITTIKSDITEPTTTIKLYITEPIPTYNYYTSKSIDYSQTPSPIRVPRVPGYHPVILYNKADGYFYRFQ